MSGERVGGLRFCLVFAFLTIGSFAALYALQDTVIAALNRHVAWVSGLLLGAIGSRVAVSGSVVAASGFAVEIKNNCNAAYEAGLFAAAVWAYPAPARTKAIGTLVGFSVLYAVNLLRVVNLVGLGLFARSWFDVAHLYVWQALFISVVAACWFGWIVRVPRAA
jgi:exosortase H (IPTLxxWG-CTERM-specific)